MLSLAIGGVLAVWPSTISDATALAIEGPDRGGINWYVVVFWFVVLLWTVVLYLRMRDDDRKEQARVDDLIGAIWRAPNYKAVISYRELFRQVAEYLTDIPDSETPSRDRRDRKGNVQGRTSRGRRSLHKLRGARQENGRAQPRRAARVRREEGDSTDSQGVCHTGRFLRVVAAGGVCLGVCLESSKVEHPRT